MIKKWIVFLLLCFYSTAQSQENERFLRGHKLYQEDKKEQALQEYQAITKKGPVTWYNIGVCLYQEKNYKQALIAFKKAERGANITLLKTIAPLLVAIQDKLGIPKEPEWRIFMKQYAAHFSLFWLQVACIMTWLLVVILSYMCVRKRVLSLLMLLFLLTAASLGIVWWVSVSHYGIVTEHCFLFAGPNEEFHTTGQVGEAQEVIIQEEKKQWYKVKTAQQVGWISASCLESIK